MSTVRCGLDMDEAGLNATLIVTGMPVERPPSMPPALFVRVLTDPSLAMRYGSLFCEPRSDEPANPDPNSTPLTDGIENIALPMSDSSEPNIGSPRPTGRPVVTDSTIPPSESPSRLAASMASRMRAAAAGSGHRTSLAYMARSGLARGASPPFPPPIPTPPICAVYEHVRTPSASASSFLATAPPITCVAVSLPENMPPPRWSLWPPYFSLAG